METPVSPGNSGASRLIAPAVYFWKQRKYIQGSGKKRQSQRRHNNAASRRHPTLHAQNCGGDGVRNDNRGYRGPDHPTCSHHAGVDRFAVKVIYRGNARLRQETRSPVLAGFVVDVFDQDFSCGKRLPVYSCVADLLAVPTCSYVFRNNNKDFSLRS